MAQEDWRVYGLADTYNLFKAEGGKDTDIYQRVRFGINTHFDLVNYLEGFGISIKSKSGKIRIDGTWLDKRQVNSELEDREILMKKWLEQNILPAGS